VLRGGPREAQVHRALNKVKSISVHAEDGRAAGELLGRAGFSGREHVLDAIVAVVALARPRPVVVLTSDTKDLERLTDEPGRPRRERVAVVRV
jgi:hypothetical protein